MGRKRCLVLGFVKTDKHRFAGIDEWTFDELSVFGKRLEALGLGHLGELFFKIAGPVAFTRSVEELRDGLARTLV